MENYFPADVSLRYTGDLAASQSLFPLAKQLLSRALKMKQTGSQLVKLFLPGTDGSLIYVVLMGNLKHVYVQPGPTTPEAVEEEEEAIEEFGATTCPNMLSGVVVPATGILQQANDVDLSNADGTPDYALHEFYPTLPTATVYSIDLAWQDVDRLGVEASPLITADTLQPGDMQVRWPKPSCYSGPMKRVVQALYGIGKTEDDGPGQISDDRYAFAPYYAAINVYDFHWNRTDGVLMDNTGKPWLVRISKDDGLLAMPLPVFDCTTGDAFRAALADIGDVDTYSVVLELGGLPTGETFPDNFPDAVPPTFDRDAAIAAGRMLVLLTPADLSPFFIDPGSGVEKEGWSDHWGWAFSETGVTKEVHNTCRWYKSPAIALSSYLIDVDAYAREDRFLTSEHWKIAIELVAAEEGATGIGSGTATLSLVERGYMYAPVNPTTLPGVNILSEVAPIFRVPITENDERVFPRPYWGRILAGDLGGTNGDIDLVAPVWVCFNGEDLEVVHHQAAATYINGTINAVTYDFLQSDQLPHQYGDDLADAAGHPSPFGGVYTGIFLVPVYTIVSGSIEVWGAQKTQDLDITYKRSGDFYSTSMDLREVGQYSSVFAATARVEHLSGDDGRGSRVVLLGENWNAEIGILFPVGCRESYTMVRYHSRVTAHGGGQANEDASGVYPPDFGLPDPLTGIDPLVEDLSAQFPGKPLIPDGGRVQVRTFLGNVGTRAGPHLTNTYIPAQEGGNIDGDEWTLRWTTLDIRQMKCAASVNAGPSLAYAMTDGVIPNWNDAGVEFGPGPFNKGVGVLREGAGIDLGVATPSEVTFVGAV